MAPSADPTAAPTNDTAPSPATAPEPSGEDPTAAPPEGTRPSATPGIVDELVGHYVPGAGGRSGLKRWVLLASVLAISVGTSIGTSAVQDFWDWLRSDAHAKRDDKAASNLDEAKAPFATIVTRLSEDDQIPQILIDKPFTATQLQELEHLNMQNSADIKRYYEILKEHKARRINTPSYPTVDASAYSSVYQLNIYSEKDEALTINGLEAVGIHCTDISTAKTVIEQPHQGDIDASGLLLDLDGRPSDPININPDAKDLGKPFFSLHGITVGGSMSPGLVRLEAATGKARCTFELRARYTANDGAHSTIITDNGNPFIAESLPIHPSQELAINPLDPYFHDCSTDPVDGCSTYNPADTGADSGSTVTGARYGEPLM